MKNYVDNGTTLNYTNAGGTTIASGTVLKTGNILGVALADIKAGETGAIQIRGKITAPKVSAAVFAQGEKLLWDVSANSGAGAFDDSSATPAAGDVMGAAFAAVAGANTETTCTVVLSPGNTTVS